MNQIELSEKELEGYLAARRFAKELGKEIAGKLEAGMTEKDAEKIASEVFKAREVKQHWHMPIIGVGAGTTKLQSAYSLASSYFTGNKRVLNKNDLVLLDIAPVYRGYPADYTTMHILGSNPELEALVTYARDVSRKIAKHITRDMIVADVFKWANELVRTGSEYKLEYPPFISMGHRLCKIPPLWQKLPEAGLTYLLLGKRGSFITSGNKKQMKGLWVVEPYLMHNGRAAKFEELVFVGDETVILDRDG